MGEHVTGYLNIHTTSDNSVPPGQVTKVLITMGKKMTPAQRLQLLAALKKVGTDFGMVVEER